MPDPIVTPSLADAAKALRDSVAALPDELHQQWRSERQFVDTHDATVAQVHGWRGTQAQPAIAQHIARTASPDVVTALADLLDAIEAQASGVRGGWLDHGIDRASVTLAAAILRNRP